MPHPLSHKYPIPISQLCLVNTDVPAGVGAPPVDTTPSVDSGALHGCGFLMFTLCASTLARSACTLTVKLATKHFLHSPAQSLTRPQYSGTDEYKTKQSNKLKKGRARSSRKYKYRPKLQRKQTRIRINKKYPH